ncbi:MAG: ATP-binding protein [Ferruginibacter sp.]
MLDSFLNEFSFIRDTIEKDGDHNFFGREFSFFDAEPILFYNNATDVIVYANSMFTKEFDYTAQDLSEWNYSILPLLNKEDHEPFKTAMQSLLDGDGLTPFPDTTYRLIRKGKKYGYYRVKVRKLHKSYYYIQLENAAGLAIPVLKNNTADDLMQNAEAILQFGFWMWDFTVDKLYWTKGMYQLLEYDGEDEAENLAVTPKLYSSHMLSGASFDREFFDNRINNPYDRKYQLKTNKGNLLTVSEYGNIEYDEDGKPRCAMGIIRNITLQEESMKSLADYKSMMQENETFLNYGTWESDADGNAIYWSEGMYNIFGYDQAAKKDLIINNDLYLLHMNMSPEESQAGRAKNVIDNNIDHYQWDYEIKDHKGKVKLLCTYGKIIRNNEGKIQKIIGTTKDVTELREYERTLENKIMELNRSNQELEEFAYVASHDLQEPLRKISTFGQRLQLRFLDKLGDDGNLYIDRMIGACDNMRRLIDNLLEFSRISLNKSPDELIDLAEIVKQAMDGLDLIIAETNTTIIIDSLPIIEGIGSQMLQVFSNILNNSIKFRNENIPLIINIQSGKLSAKEKTAYQLDPASTFYIITIKDNGVGFEQQYATRIFQVFQRLQGKSEYPGTGIGLSICKKIVTNHKGLIFANSEPGKGAVFSIILPQQQ